MSPSSHFLLIGVRSFPRVSGDEPHHGTNLREDLEFSPRERG